MAKAEAEAFGGGSKPTIVPMLKKQQTLMSAFAMDTACFMDERLVKEMKAVRKTRTAAKAEAKAEAPALAPALALAPAAEQKKKPVKSKKDTT
jgi:hypothetical protein